MVADGVAQIAAERGGASGHNDDPSKVELVFVIGQKTRQQESDLTGDGDAGAFRQQGHSHGPVTVVGDEGAEKVESRVVHGRSVRRLALQRSPSP